MTEMPYRYLGQTGLKLSALSLGAWVTFGNQIEGSSVDEIMCTAYEAGVNFFDNAEGYASGKAEIEMGRVIKGQAWPRDSFVISSKVFWGAERKGPNQVGLGRKHIIECCHDAMKRLQVDYLDLYYCHNNEPEVPVGEIVWTMNDLLQQGKILYWGTSKWPKERIQAALDFAKNHNLRGPTVEQPEYNMFCRETVEKDYRKFCKEDGLGLTTFSPLASGLLTGKYNNGFPEGSRLSREDMSWFKPQIESGEFDRKINKIKKLQEVAKQLDTKMPQLALAWCLKNPNISSIITGASKVNQLKNNIESLSIAEKLNKEILDQIQEIISV